MKPLFLVTVSALALLGLAACTPSGRPTARAALDCPDHQGELTRTGVAPDRRSCTYRTADGADVTLQLVSTNGDPKAALGALETSLAGPTPELVKGEKAAEAVKGEAVKPAEATKASTDAAEKAVQEARADAAKAPGGSSDDEVNVRFPGGHIEAHDNGSGSGSDKAHIDLPGIHINADGDTDEADVKVGGVTINANGDGATIRVYREVRLRGEAFSSQKRGLRATYIYTGKDMPSGYRFVGYEAGGPKAGPITVAVVRSNVDGDEGDMHGRAYRDIKRLVRRNSGT